MLYWCRRFNIFILLDSNGYYPEQAGFDWMLAAGCKESVSLERGKGFDKLQAFHDKHKTWLFGHLGYELMNEKKDAFPKTGNEVDFGDGFFFIPGILISLKQQELTIECSSLFPEAILAEIHASPAVIEKPVQEPIILKHGITAETYIEKILALKRHILRGDCYEINFCQSFYANNASINPLFVYQQLAALSPNPFGAFYRLYDKYCLCASPERFLKKTSNTIISQPIKGTAKRNLENEALDIAARNYLLNSEKEKSENVMIVDLVRNDLSKVCTEGSVQVTELFGVYPFPQVHQLISTIEGNVNEDTPFTAILEACFPMGSMTGAPKKRVMELIEQYEQTPRGLFSGSIGYITPSADFDFNVVIRSLMLDASQKLISFKAGGGITFNSDPEQEYEECLLKAEAIRRVLG